MTHADPHFQPEENCVCGCAECAEEDQGQWFCCCPGCDCNDREAEPDE